MTKPVTPAEPSPTAGHTIAVVAERTGLSRDVLRVWERRYQAVEPARTAGGQRLYSNEQLHRFMLLAEATRQGRSISSIAGLSTEALAQLAVDDGAARARATTVTASTPTPVATTDHHLLYRDVADRALVQAMALDASGLDRELRRAVGRYGLPAFLEAIVPMLMRRIGDEWEAGRLAIPHEHLASAVVLTILLESVRVVPETPGAPRLLVATPAGEHHVVGAALIAAAAALDGWSILFLGADVPAVDLVLAAKGVRAVALSLVHPRDAAHAVREVRQVRASLPLGVRMIVGGASATYLRDELSEPGVTVCNNIADARATLAAIVRG
jgi:DNA-binding transcriptional MerR regulator/methylmalonyl-CoA mutase cobalamin-binding subunit